MQYEQTVGLPLQVIGVASSKTRRERVAILALREIDLRDPAAIISLGSKTGIRRKITKAVAMPPMRLAAGDQLILYTAGGRDSVETVSGSTVNRVYLGIRKPLWGGLRALRIVDLTTLAAGLSLPELMDIHPGAARPEEATAV